MLDITDPAIFVEAITAIRQLIERVQSVLENGELKIKLYGKLGALLKRSTEPKKQTPPGRKQEGANNDSCGARNRRYLHLDFAIV